MIPVMCIIQEGQVSPEAEKGLKAQISSFTQRAFAVSADIDWVVVPIGCGFTAAEPSRAVNAALHPNRPLKQAERLTLLEELRDICITHTGRSVNEVMTSIGNFKEA